MKLGRLTTEAWMRTAVCSILLTIAPAAFAQDGIKDPAGGLKPQSRDKVAVSTDVQKIRLDQDKISAIRTEMRRDRSAGNHRGVIMEKKDLAKASADEKRDASHLKADRRDMLRADNLAIRESKKAIRHDKVRLASSRRELRRKEHMRKGDTATDIEDQADRMAYDQHKLNEDSQRLYLQRKKKKEDMTFMRKEEKRLQ